MTTTTNTIAKTKLTDDQIARLEEAGGKRWQKFGKDRIYFDATKCGLELSYYKSGNISGSILNGVVISHANGYMLKATKFYVEVSDGSVHADYNGGTARKNELIDQIVEHITALLDEPEASEESLEDKEPENAKNDTEQATEQQATRTVYTVTDGFGEYRQYGDNIELVINNTGGEDFEDKEEAIARYIELSGRGAMRAAWSCEFECGGCIRKALAYQVELVAYSEEYDADSDDWNVLESNMIYCETYDIDDYKADMD